MDTAEKPPVRYPAMRHYLVYSLADLADREHQERYWVRREPEPNGLNESFDGPVHCLFDDLAFEDDPRPDRFLGVILRDEQEWAAVMRVVAAVNAVFDDLGIGATDEQYVRSRGWPAVVAAAAEALRVLDDDPRQAPDVPPTAEPTSN